MAETLDEQFCLHDAAALCLVALLRPALFEQEAPMPIIGAELNREGLLERLRPALETAWPDGPAAIDDLQPFLLAAYERIVDRARELAGAEGLVPAARWLDGAGD